MNDSLDNHLDDDIPDPVRDRPEPQDGPVVEVPNQVWSGTAENITFDPDFLRSLGLPPGTVEGLHIANAPAILFSVARLLESWGASDHAVAWMRAGLVLETQLKAHDDELLTVDQAVEESGYSRSGVWRLIHEGGLAFYGGEPRRPLLKRGDLPRKMGKARLFV